MPVAPISLDAPATKMYARSRSARKNNLLQKKPRPKTARGEGCLGNYGKSPRTSVASATRPTARM
jgi:hypothetical protein